MSPAFERLQGFPGLGVLNRIRPFLLVPHFERSTTYQFDEMHRISHVLYSHETPVVLIYNKDAIGGADLSLIRFFGPAYPPQANLTMLPDNYPVQCEETMPTPSHLDKVSHCVGMTTDTLQQFTGQGVTVFFLTSLVIQDDIPRPFRYTEVLRTQSYRLGTIAP